VIHLDLVFLKVLVPLVVPVVQALLFVLKDLKVRVHLEVLMDLVVQLLLFHLIHLLGLDCQHVLEIHWVQLGPLHLFLLQDLVDQLSQGNLILHEDLVHQQDQTDQLDPVDQQVLVHPLDLQVPSHQVDLLVLEDLEDQGNLLDQLGHLLQLNLVDQMDLLDLVLPFVLEALLDQVHQLILALLVDLVVPGGLILLFVLVDLVVLVDLLVLQVLVIPVDLVHHVVQLRP